MAEISREALAGITEYIGACCGFTGVLKSRYSDFQVHEINANGEVASLTDVTLPSLPKDEKSGEERGGGGADNGHFDEVLSRETWDELKALTDSNKVQIDATAMTKEQRTAVHNAVKKVFGRKIVGSTVSTDDKKYLVFSKFTKGTKIDSREKWEWKGDFVHFLVYKENCDTMEAASQIAERLKMKSFKPTYFGYCGTKDKRAKTCQWFSIKRVEPKKIMNGCRGMRNIKVGNFSFRDYHLKLGQLKGNLFKIAVRNVTAAKQTVEEALLSLKEKGFVNYYGLQRFGNRVDVPTYSIGKCLLQENFEEAVNLILSPHDGKNYRALKTYRDTKDANLAMSKVPYHGHRSIEMKLLQALKNESGNKSASKYVNALNKLPRNTRLLYIHSYQSWVWNLCVSERLKRFGFECRPGDLVLLDPANFDSDVTIDMIEENCEENDSDNHPQNDDANCKAADAKEKVKVLTSDDIAGGQYNIYDVVMPLPGFDIVYPPNMKDHYEKILASDNLNLDLKQKLKSYSLGGAYRNVAVKPEEVSWEQIRYDDPHCDLILSDLDVLNNKASVKNVEDGKYNALVLKLSLPSSTYATMALRELMKTDTSKEYHSQNNSYYKDELVKVTDESQSEVREKRKALDDGNESISKVMKKDY